MRLLLRLSIFLMFVPASLPADRLSTKYRSWDKSPEAYFLTSQERAQWKRTQVDADAEKFVADYFARRGPDFPVMLKGRIAVADKYFSPAAARSPRPRREVQPSRKPQSRVRRQFDRPAGSSVTSSLLLPQPRRAAVPSP